ncbi:chalcone and stilbene synthase domain protein [Pseudofrankia inefficax]|uniref:Chalcone and stilbene synthase domain protein n=1 Tax=Pseudofrankia inefficax (strain DSM 45817 / CECT 9037 / DDB 130130 / EuI1c) TaxID=298654 RepID=E3J5E9_PSEI1|nr:chalcone and stilbene synthase domain protein [Pseudofrankia inefficax]
MPAEMFPTLLAVSTAAPGAPIAQTDIWDEFYAAVFAGVPNARRLFVEANTVERRHLNWDPRTAFRDGFPPVGPRVEAWEQCALDLGRRTLPAVLAGRDRSKVGTFVMVSSTGYVCPGPDSQLVAELGLRPDVRRVFVGHMGCYAALVGLRAALDALAARPDELVLLTCVEVTSAHLRGEATREQAVVHGLFGDACASVLLGAVPGHTGPEAGPTPAPIAAAVPAGPITPGGPVDGPDSGAVAVAIGARVLATRTEVVPDTAEHMSIRIHEEGFRLRLSPAIPSLIRAGTPGFVDRLLAGTGLSPGDIRHWVLHPGGPRIIDAVGDAFGLTDAQLRPSRETLRDYGNCSSVTVLLALRRLMSGEAGEPPSAGDNAILIAFGPGLTTEAALVRF